MNSEKFIMRSDQFGKLVLVNSWANPPLVSGKNSTVEVGELSVGPGSGV